MGNRRFGVGERQSCKQRGHRHPAPQIDTAEILHKLRQYVEYMTCGRHGVIGRYRVVVDVPQAFQRVGQRIKPGADRQRTRFSEHEPWVDDGVGRIKILPCERILLLIRFVPDRGPAGYFAAGPGGGGNSDDRGRRKRFLAFLAFQVSNDFVEVAARGREPLGRVDNGPAADSDDDVRLYLQFREAAGLVGQQSIVGIGGDVPYEQSGGAWALFQSARKLVEDRLAIGHQSISTISDQFRELGETIDAKFNLDRISEFPRHRAPPFCATVENFNLLTNSYLRYDLLIMSIVFSQLRAFHAVAEHGGFTAASRVLNVGQPTLTIQVRDLEAAYGVELLIRRSRRIELTPTGATLFEITRGVMKFCDEAHELLASHGLSTKGHLRLATVGPFHATEILAAFRDDARVVMIPYRTHRVVVFVNGDHPWFNRKSVTLRELADQPFVLREHGSTTRRAFEAAMAEQGLRINPVFEIESREGVWKAVERGLGISVVADFEFVPHSNLRTLEIRDRVIETQYSIAYHRDRAHSPIIKAFIDTVSRMKEGPAQVSTKQRRARRS